MIKKRVTVFNIKEKDINSISQYLCDYEEPVFSSKFNCNFPSIKGYLSGEYFVVLTFGWIYLFYQKLRKNKLVEKIDIFDCQKIQYFKENDQKIKIIKIKTPQYQDCYTIYKEKNIKKFFDYISGIIFILSNGIPLQSNIPVLEPKLKVVNYSVPYLICKRSLYLIHSDYRKKNLPDLNARLGKANYFDNFNIYRENSLVINDFFFPTTYSSYYARAIGSIPNIEEIYFNNFSHQFNEFIDSIFIYCNNIKKITFGNYSAEAPTFHFDKLKDEYKHKFIFFDSQPPILINFFNGLQQSSCKITKICLSKLAIQGGELASIFEQMNKIESLKHLKSFELFNTMIGQFPFESFTDFLNSHEELEVLDVSNIDVDGTMLLDAICECNPSIYELHLTNLKFATILKVKNDRDGTLFLPDNLILADFSYSLFNHNTLSPILQLLTNNPMKGSLMANFDHLYDKEKRGNYFLAFESLELNKCYPNIIDFNWSGNTVSKKFFDFICTQKNLKFISLMDMHIRNQKSFFDHLLRVMREVRPIGIEIGCESFEAELVKPFLSALKESSQLEHLCFESQNEQNEITASLSDLITSLPNLKEISINIPKLEHDAYINLAASITSNKSVLAINFMKYEYKDKDKKQKYPEIEVLYSSIQKLKIPTTMEQRAEALILTQQENEGNETDANTLDLTKTIYLKGLNHKVEEVSEDENTNTDTEDEEKSSAQEITTNESSKTKDNIFINDKEEKFYKIIEPIEETATSITYKVVDERTNQIICRKELKLNEQIQFRDRKNFLKEIDILCGINHPCICKYIGANLEEKVDDSGITTHSLFYEYLELCLDDVYDKLDNTMKTKICIEIAHAMKFIHQHKLIHRNLNTTNIRLDESFTAKITDFGVAIFEESIEDESLFMTKSVNKKFTTFCFISPEMRNEEQYNNKTDVYSFGVLLLYIFTGKVPEQNMNDIVSRKKNLPSPSSSISKECIDLISRCISMQPDDRPSFEDIIKYMRDISYSLASNVNIKLISSRDQELESYEK